MKVQLIVVQGKPEGKVIPLSGPLFKIGRGETCHLRPNSEQVSREHAAFELIDDTVSVRDLGSRNGTLVNGKAISGSCQLKDNDLVQVGPLTFSVSIQGASASAKASAPPASRKASPEDVSHDDIEAWLIADSKSPAPERPSGVYKGDTITISAFKDKETPPPPPAKPKAAAVPAPAPKPAPLEDSDEEYERLPEGEGDAESDELGDDDSGDGEAASEGASEEFIDESNPFYVKKKGPEPAAGPAKPEFKDTSDAANDILRKMMDRRRSSR